jgi:hypothetical protein
MRNAILSLGAVLGVLLLAVGGVAAYAHNEGASADERAPANGSAAKWAMWMEQHMTKQLGAEAAAQMQDRMGMSYEEMGEYMASHQNDSMMDGMMNGQMMGGMMDGMMRGEMSGMGCH